MLYEDAKLIVGGPDRSCYLESLTPRHIQAYIEAAQRLAQYHLNTRCDRDWGEGNGCGRDKGHEGSCAVFMRDKPNNTVKLECRHKATLIYDTDGMICVCEYCGQKLTTTFSER